MNENSLLNQLRAIECQLSPEHLYCDGEASREYVIARSHALNAEKHRLIERLGRTPTDRELWAVQDYL